MVTLINMKDAKYTTYYNVQTFYNNTRYMYVTSWNTPPPPLWLPKVTRTNILIQVERFYHKKCSCQILKFQHSLFKSYYLVLSFQKLSQTTRSKSQLGSRILVPQKWYSHKEYSCKHQSSSTQCWTVINKVKVFKK